jgi:predicted nucleic acid-binding protein
VGLVLLDTNVLVRLADSRDPQHGDADGAARKLRGAGDRLHTVSQCHVEFWSVVTRPAANNGLGLAAAEAARQLRILDTLYPRLPDADGDAVYPNWLRIVQAVGVSGKQVHDARLVAAMLTLGMTHILTFNVADFARFAAPNGITVLDPRAV